LIVFSTAYEVTAHLDQAVCLGLKPRFRSANFEFRSGSVARTRGRQPGVLPTNSAK
jgi:hypothetical protein